MDDIGNTRMWFPNTVYFAYSPMCNMVKIGCTVNLKNRFKSIQSNCPDPNLELLFFFKGDDKVEKNIQKKFDEFRSHGEWFHYSKEIENYIQKLILNTQKG